MPPPPDDSPLLPIGEVYGHKYEVAGFGDRNKAHRWFNASEDRSLIFAEREQRLSNMHTVKITSPQGETKYRSFLGFVTDDFTYADAVKELIERNS